MPWRRAVLQLAAIGAATAAPHNPTRRVPLTATPPTMHSEGALRRARTGLSHLGLRAKLVALLFAFGVLPLVVAIAVGYGASRATILRQAQGSLDAMARAQAVHLATELARERLLLRTIAGQLPPLSRLQRATPDSVSDVLVHALPDEGVFDGLRIVTPRGVLASVALGNTAPHWPAEAPATEWADRSVVVHREGAEVLAYLVATPLDDGQEGWLEGHVRREDFSRAFALPEHLQDGVESAVFEPGAAAVFGMHEHAAEELARYADPSTRPEAYDGPPALVSRCLVATTDWIFVAALPLDVALAPFARLRNTALAGAGGLVLLIVLTGVLAARSVTTPLHELAAAARDFGREGRHQPLVARRQDEVGTLVTAFSTMAATLQHSREKIDALHAHDLERAQQLATVGELASGVAHEIRNPLTGVRGALELALKRLPPGEASRPLLEEAEQQLARMERATTQLLRYARPAEPKELTVDGNLLVERATHVVSAQAASGGVTLRAEPSADPVPVRVDPEQMVQVLVNLMLNGIDVTEAGGQLTVWVARHAPDMWIGVQDTGPGVPPAHRAEILRPFFTTKHHGTGLGLPISHQIVTRHGGSLRVEETPGGGATFVVTIPLAPTQESGA